MAVAVLPAVPTMTSGLAFLPGLLEGRGERLGRLGAGEPELAVNHEERDAADPEGAAFLEVHPDVVGVLVGGEQFVQFHGADPKVRAQGRQVLPAADVPAVLEVVAEQAFLCGVLLSVRGSEVDQPVGGEAVGHHHVVEAVVEALALGLLRHVREHSGDLGRGHPLAGAQVVQFGAVVVLRQRRVQLVAAPLNLHGLPVREGREGGFKAAFADVAPGAGHVGPDLNLHARHNPDAAGRIPRRDCRLGHGVTGRSITKSYSTVLPSVKDLVPTFRKPDFS